MPRAKRLPSRWTWIAGAACAPALLAAAALPSTSADLASRRAAAALASPLAPADLAPRRGPAELASWRASIDLASPRASAELASRPAAAALASTRAPAQAPREAALQAFGEIAGVLRHPRCLNCHTVTSFPRQGDDRHPHANLVRRGLADRGVPGMACATCHQAENNPASGVPGKPNWHLAPLSMGWEGLSDGELCRVFKDPRRNGGRDLAALTAHLRDDPLVAYGWDPGANRRPVPVPRQELVRLVEAWARAGAPCPAAADAAD